MKTIEIHRMSVLSYFYWISDDSATPHIPDNNLGPVSADCRLATYVSRSVAKTYGNLRTQYADCDIWTGPSTLGTKIGAPGAGWTFKNQICIYYYKK